MKYINFIMLLLCMNIVCSSSDFIIDKKTDDKNISGTAQKGKTEKYSQLHQELLEEYEWLMRCHAECLRKIADAQECCIDAFKKTIENSPKMSREQIKKEREHVQVVCNNLETISFF